MKQLFLTCFITIMLSSLAMAQTVNGDVKSQNIAKYHFEVIGEFKEKVGNIAVSKEQRIFVSFLPLSNPQYKVMELIDDKLVAFPNKKTSAALSAVIGLRVSQQGILWVLDMKGMLFGYDIATGKTVNTIDIKSAMHDLSYVQDFALDQKHNFIYIADLSRGNGIGASTPGIISVNLKTGKSHKWLAGHPSVQSDGGIINISGKIFSATTPSGKHIPARYGLNPITISSDYSYVYYGSMNGEMVYRVPTQALTDFTLTEPEVEALVENYGRKTVSDGISIDNDNNVYISDVNHYGIGVTKANGEYELLFSDPRISWPDGFSCGGDGMMYVTINKLHLNPGVNKGVQESTPPYLIAKFKPLAQCAVGR